jgi:hypothetical protein
VEGIEDIIPKLQEDVVPMERSLTFQQLLSRTNEIENFDTHFGPKIDFGLVGLERC